MDTRKLGAEALGTFWLVLGGCGSAVLAANFLPDTNLGIGLVGVSLAFGLTVLTGAYALGHVSGGHFNPAVTLGLVAGKRFPASDAVPYIVAQVIGGIAAAAVIAIIASGVDGFSIKRLGLRRQRLRRPVAGRLQPARRAGVRDRDDRDVPHRDHGRDPARRPQRHGSRRDRAGAHAHPPHLDPGHEHVGEPGPIDIAGAVRRRRLPAAAVAVLGGARSSAVCSGRSSTGRCSACPKRTSTAR